MFVIGTESNGLNLFSRIGKIVKQDLGFLFITSGSSHFLNKTDLEHYVFNHSHFMPCIVYVQYVTEKMNDQGL